MPALIEQGASQRRILIAGHSHAYALGLPGAKADAEPQVVAIAPGFDGLTGPWPRTNHYWDLLAQEAKSGSYTVALSFLGNDHLAHFLIEESPFDFVRSEDPDEDVRRAVPLVPEALVREMFKPHASTLPAILGKLKRAGVPTLVLGTPPPKQGLESLLATEPFFIKRLQALGMSTENVALCPSGLQLKLWRLLQTMLREAAEANGAVFVPFPADLVNEDGYLRPEYARDDVTHANAEAGVAVRNELAALVGEAA
jgi:hypothetical protein